MKAGAREAEHELVDMTKDEILGPKYASAIALGDKAYAKAIEAARRKAQPVRALALDGGGMRGVYQAIVVRHLRDALRLQLSRPNLELADVFDLIAGTSAGGILAAALLTPDGALSQAADRCAELERFYVDLVVLC